VEDTIEKERKRVKWQAAADRAAETGLYPLRDEGEIEKVKFQPAPCVVFDPNSPSSFGVTLAPDQESRLADAVAERVLRAMGREMRN
jgi:hypothetical protein